MRRPIFLAAAIVACGFNVVSADQAYVDTILRHHNVHRANSNAAPLSWSPALAETARKIGSSCVFDHNVDMDGGGYGQNIASGFPPWEMGRLITDAFYNSEVGMYYNYGGEPDGFGPWGHYTQIVWKETREVGCHTMECAGTGADHFTVCNYWPAGK